MQPSLGPSPNRHLRQALQAARKRYRSPLQGKMPRRPAKKAAGKVHLTDYGRRQIRRGGAALLAAVAGVLLLSPLADAYHYGNFYSKADCAAVSQGVQDRANCELLADQLEDRSDLVFPLRLHHQYRQFDRPVDVILADSNHDRVYSLSRPASEALFSTYESKLDDHYGEGIDGDRLRFEARQRLVEKLQGPELNLALLKYDLEKSGFLRPVMSQLDALGVRFEAAPKGTHSIPEGAKVAWTVSLGLDANLTGLTGPDGTRVIRVSGEPTMAFDRVKIGYALMHEAVRDAVDPSVPLPERLERTRTLTGSLIGSSLSSFDLEQSEAMVRAIDEAGITDPYLATHVMSTYFAARSGLIHPEEPLPYFPAAAQLQKFVFESASDGILNRLLRDELHGGASKQDEFIDQQYAAWLELGGAPVAADPNGYRSFDYKGFLDALDAASVKFK